jgi:ubiquinol-cytochrome c reductase cytochrome b subunit
MEEDNFMLVDLISSPLHIKPEWYFLFVYAVLRSIFNKVLGVTVMVLMLFAVISISAKYSNQGYFFYKIFVLSWVIVCIMLTKLGGRPIRLVCVFWSLFFGWAYFVFIFCCVIS